MSQHFSKRDQSRFRNRRTVKRGGLGAIFAILVALLATMNPVGANIPGSTFGGGDGNFTAPDANGTTDWAVLNAAQAAALSKKADLPSGQADNSFGNGTKTSDTNVTVGLGGIPNNKADLGNSYITSETAANGDVYMYLGVTRVTVSGTVNLDIEVNQAAQPDLTTPGPKVLVRTVGDILINYDFQGGSQKPTLAIRTWNGLVWGAPQSVSSANGEAEVNRVALANPLALPPSPANAPAFTFGEASLNLTGLGIIPAGECAPFSSAYVKSRASASFTSAVKDFIAPQAINLDNCGSITIEKQTDPDGALDEFGFTLTGPNSTNEAFNLADGGSNTTSGLQSGTYVATETTLPTGWDPDGAVCSDGSEADAIDLGVNEDVTCVFSNVARADLHIVKDAERDGVDFDFAADSPLDPASFTLQNGGTQDYLGLVPGTYGVNETVPDGWDLTSMDCDNGDTADAVALVAGDDVTCTFVNDIERGSLLIHKQAKHAASDSGVIPLEGVHFHVTNANGTDADVATNAAGDACVADVPVSFLDGAYNVVEQVPAGYHAVDADQDYTVVAGTTCETAEALVFDNTPLTKVTVSVDSAVDGGTASTIDCDDGTSGVTDANGDGSVTTPDLEPRTLVCTVVIDP